MNNQREDERRTCSFKIFDFTINGVLDKLLYNFNNIPVILLLIIKIKLKQ